MKVKQADATNIKEWVKLRCLLWPEDTHEEHRSAVGEILKASPRSDVAFVAIDEESTVVAFAEASLINHYVNGCNTIPVTF